MGRTDGNWDDGSITGGLAERLARRFKSILGSPNLHRNAEYRRFRLRVSKLGMWMSVSERN